MIEIFIFHLHIMAGLFAFTKYWQKIGLKEGFLALGVIALMFVVGWTIAGTVANIIYPDDFNSIYFTKDTLGLVLLFIPEFFFFYYFFIKDEPKSTKN